MNNREQNFALVRALLSSTTFASKKRGECRSIETHVLPILIYGNCSLLGIPRARVCSYTQLLLTFNSPATSPTVSSSSKPAFSDSADAAGTVVVDHARLGSILLIWFSFL